MNHSKLRCRILLIVSFTMLLVFGNNVSAQSQDPCAGERANLKRLYAQQNDQKNNPNNYTLADANRLAGDITTALKTLADCEKAHGNSGNAKPTTPAKQTTPPQSGSAQPADPSNGSDKVRQALIEAQRQLDAASNFRPGTYSGKVDEFPAIIKTFTLESDGRNVFFGSGPERILMTKESINVYSFTTDHTGSYSGTTYNFHNKNTFSFTSPGKSRFTYSYTVNGQPSGSDYEASLVLQGSSKSGDPKMSDARQKERDRILSNPLLQDPPKDAPVGDGSGKPSGFTDGTVDFSTDKSQTPPATPPADQN